MSYTASLLSYDEKECVLYVCTEMSLKPHLLGYGSDFFTNTGGGIS